MKVDSSAPREKLSTLFNESSGKNKTSAKRLSAQKAVPGFKSLEQLRISLDRLIRVRLRGGAGSGNEHLQGLLRQLAASVRRLPAGFKGAPEYTQETELLLKIVKVLAEKDLPRRAVRDLRVLERVLEQEKRDLPVLLYPPDVESGRPEIRMEGESAPLEGEQGETSTLQMTLDCPRLGRITVSLESIRRDNEKKCFCRIVPSEKETVEVVRKSRERLRQRLLDRGLLPDRIKISPSGREGGPESKEGAPEEKRREGVDLWG
ncbi:MAG: flagellar hook-length control protein FliK [Spirochaetales bacterium]|nr:flagellar hook-length control protein FliK [Spirochaetales bacterium]